VIISLELEGRKPLDIEKLTTAGVRKNFKYITYDCEKNFILEKDG
jgi:hypothetical protein